jgi:uncharacterized protein (DUF1330 family)
MDCFNNEVENQMTKAYWVATYREIKNQDHLTEYAKLAGPAIAACGGRFLARGLPSIAKEAGLIQRVVLIEFDSLDMAKGAYESDAYQAALQALGHDSVVRDIRIIEAS